MTHGMEFRTAVAVLQLLRQPRTVYDIASLRGVSVKTARRWLEELAALGFDLRSQVDNDRGRKVHRVVGAGAAVARMLAGPSPARSQP